MQVALRSGKHRLILNARILLRDGYEKVVLFAQVCLKQRIDRLLEHGFGRPLPEQ